MYIRYTFPHHWCRLLMLFVNYAHPKQLPSRCSVRIHAHRFCCASHYPWYVRRVRQLITAPRLLRMERFFLECIQLRGLVFVFCFPSPHTLGGTVLLEFTSPARMNWASGDLWSKCSKLEGKIVSNFDFSCKMGWNSGRSSTYTAHAHPCLHSKESSVYLLVAVLQSLLCDTVLLLSAACM